MTAQDATASLGAVTAAEVASLVRQHRVEQFLYHEAALLDDHDYASWLDLFAEDAHYFVPLRRTRTTRDRDREFTRPDEVAWFNDNKKRLAGRVDKLATGRSWSEDPPSRTRHLITNVRVVADDGAELEVHANFHLYRTRLRSEEDSWIGSRRDVLRRAGTPAGFLIVRRTVLLEQTVLLSRNLSNFF